MFQAGVSMARIRFRELGSINHRMTGYGGANPGASRQTYEPAETDRDAAPYATI